MSTQPFKEVKSRKPRARRTDIVIALLGEVTLMSEKTDKPELMRDYFNRIAELLDELGRSLNRGTEEE